MKCAWKRPASAATRSKPWWLPAASPRSIRASSWENKRTPSPSKLSTPNSKSNLTPSTSSSPASRSSSFRSTAAASCNWPFSRPAWPSPATTRATTTAPWTSPFSAAIPTAPGSPWMARASTIPWMAARSRTSPRKSFRNSKSPASISISPPASPPPAPSTSSPAAAATNCTAAASSFSAIITWPPIPASSSLARVTASTKHDDLANARLDYRIGAAHTAFVRYSHDGNNAFAPREVNSMPSAWESNLNWADSGVFSLISTLRPTLVNEFRYPNTFWSNHNAPPTAAQCPGCIGLGGPHVTVEGAGVAFGNNTNSPQSRLVRRNIFADNVTWQHATHRMKFGGEIEFLKGTGTYTLDAPADITLFSPQEVLQLAPPLTALIPKTFNTLTDVLSLPLKTFTFGIGDINQPPTFQRSQADHDRLFHVYWQDTWKLHPRFAFNYGLAWSFESNALNHDLTKPQYLAPIFGANGLGHERHAYLRFTPAAGLAWSLPDNRTVIRGGGGIFYDTVNIENRLVERAYLGPLGTGYLPLPGSIVPNPIPGIPGLPAGTPLDIRVPTAFSGNLLGVILPLVRSSAIQQLNVNPNNTDLTLRHIDVFKTRSEERRV